MQIALLRFTIALLALSILLQAAGLHQSWWFLGTGISIFLVGIICIFGRRRSISFILLHSGVLLILAGGFITAKLSLRETITLKEGEERFLPNTHFSIRLDNFEVDHYQDGTPKMFCSEVTIFTREVAKDGRIEVNHPLSFSDLKLYQTDYGVADVGLLFTIKDEEVLVREIGERVKTGEGELEIISFLPDFVIVDGSPTTRSFDLHNPAVRVSLYRDGTHTTSWLFLKFQEYHKDFPVRFAEVIPMSYYSTIEVVKDPGAPVVFSGFLALLLGMGFRLWKRW
jgi:cytochrome c biogenesis protein